ncbi:MAG: argininosuccinate lyase [Schwartzia sp.]|nr:argininosuccinate lyase [Schwartzia sp. (in: firmicutes)]
MNKLKHIACGLLSAVTLGVCFPAVAAAAAKTAHDNFYWLGQINKATIVINSDEGLLEQDEAKRYARGLHSVLQDGDAPNADRPSLVITFEPYLIEAAGEDVTKIHAGRSSQDMLTTCSDARIREELLQLADAMNAMTDVLIQLAEQQRDTVVPNYTNGVAAQPNSYGHYLLAYANAFARDAQRLHEYYARLNRSPMGTTVLNGTSWPLNRERMADYLGFDGIAYNAYDAVQVFNLENGADAAHVASSLALHIGSFIEDVMQQYAQPRPWILLKEGGKNTYVSSAMPQKRNPGILNRTRTLASTILGDATGCLFRAHNIPPGMADSRSDGLLRMLSRTKKLATDFKDILEALEINPERAREELNLDWTASQEMADILMREHGIPFRLGHHFASEMVGHARANGLTPLTFPYGEAKRIYRETVAGHTNAPEELPLDEAAFRAALDPIAIVQNRATKGGPQKAEMDIMLDAAKTQLQADKDWTQDRLARIAAAERRLNRDFAALLEE